MRPQPVYTFCPIKLFKLCLYARLRTLSAVHQRCHGFYSALEAFSRAVASISLILFSWFTRVAEGS